MNNADLEIIALSRQSEATGRIIARLEKLEKALKVIGSPFLKYGTHQANFEYFQQIACTALAEAQAEGSEKKKEKEIQSKGTTDA